MTDDKPSDKQKQESSSRFWNFFETIKKKSKAIINVYKEDVQEFATTITEDTKKVLENTESIKQQTNKLADSVKSGFVSITERISSLFSGSSNESHSSPSSLQTEPLKLRVEQLQNSRETYTQQPEDEEFQKWLETFQLEGRSEEISRILSSNQQLFELYQQLVPNPLSSKEFWGRYYYRLEKLTIEETRRLELVKRAEELQKTKNAELTLSWDDDDVSTNNNNSNVNNLSDDKNLSSQNITIPNQNQSSQTSTTESRPPSTTTQSILKESQTPTEASPPNKEPTLTTDCPLPQTTSLPTQSDIIGKTTHSPNVVASSTTNDQNGNVPIINQSTTKDEFPSQSSGNGDDDVFNWQ